MNTITLTIEATPENLRKVGQILFGEEPPQEAAKTKPKKAKPEKSEKPAKTMTDLRELGLVLTKAGKSGRLKEILKDFGADKLSQVKPEDYEELYKKLEEEAK